MSQRVLYTAGDSPPGRAVEMALQYLDLSYEIKQVDFYNGEHLSPSYLQMYPQGELPVLDDFGYIIGESVAIIQYLACKYPRDDSFYPKDPQKNAVVHHRLAFYLSTYYRRIHDYFSKYKDPDPNDNDNIDVRVKILPMDYPYRYERTQDLENKLNHAIKILDELLSRQKTLYAAGDKLTIADLPLVMGTVVMKAMEHNLNPYPNVLGWFENFQKNQPKLWAIAKAGEEGIAYGYKNPRDMSFLKHPVHPSLKTTTA